jgi:hypothetical protein
MRHVLLVESRLLCTTVTITVPAILLERQRCNLDYRDMGSWSLRRLEAAIVVISLVQGRATEVLKGEERANWIESTSPL